MATIKTKMKNEVKTNWRPPVDGVNVQCPHGKGLNCTICYDQTFGPEHLRKKQKALFPSKQMKGGV
jgi:hypothetical protein